MRLLVTAVDRCFWRLHGCIYHCSIDALVIDGVTMMFSTRVYHVGVCETIELDFSRAEDTRRQLPQSSLSVPGMV